MKRVNIRSSLTAKQKEQRVKATPEMSRKSAKPPPSVDWHQQAGFSLFFDYMFNEHGERTWQTRIWQTRVYHDETGQETLFPGIEPALWVAWIQTQAGLPFLVRLGTDAPELFTPTPPVTARQVGLELLEPTIEPQARTLVVTLRFRISGSSAELYAATQVPYQVEFHIINLANAATNLVASERGHLQPGTLEYTSQQIFPVPELGRYELQSIVLLLSPAAVIGMYQGPVIRIIP
jgi:hypothetical protein